MPAVNWLDRRETPSRSSDRSVIGVVAAVLAVLNVLAMTSSAPRRNRNGDILATTAICERYQMTWIASPSTTAAISQISQADTYLPSLRPVRDPTTAHPA